ncbi:MAG: hypothetical protein QOH26_1826 [Actinomycetota bacterium]|jgi:uncharacterized protein YkwD|nr:hypothetical protein [Actinomycetota bacterium]
MPPIWETCLDRRHSIGKRALAAFSALSCLLVLGLSSQASAEVHPSNLVSLAGSTTDSLLGTATSSLGSAEPVPSGWLSVVNHYRSLAGLPPVTENASLSEDDRLHAKYMVKNQMMGHTEDPGLSFFTQAGKTAAENSNLTRGSYTMSHRAAIESWMVGPFHGIGIIDPRLKQVGYGAFREQGHDPSFEFGAALDVLRGRGTAPSGLVYPIKYPGANKTTYLSKYKGGETPDPLSPCAGYSAPTGAPVMLQLKSPSVVVDSSFSKAGGGELPHCIYDGTTYINPNLSVQQDARAVLSNRNAIVLIPRSPLQSGATYDVSITHGITTTEWSFKVGDVAAPVTKILQPAHGVTYDSDKLRTYTGTSSSDASRVEVSFAKYLTNGDCRFWNGSKFVARGCNKRIWLKASGTKSWSFRAPAHLASSTDDSPIANYLLWARGRDASGNQEKNLKIGRNYVGFNLSN